MNNDLRLAVVALCQSAFDAPSSAQSQGDIHALDPGDLRPLNRCQGLTVECNPRRVSSITHLLLTSRPAAICRAVWTVVVYAIYGVFTRWTRSHISKEVRERLSPSLAHQNAATAVVVISAVHRVIASPFHIFPHEKFRAVAPTVQCRSLLCRFTLQAATTACASSDQIQPLDRGYAPAITTACSTRSTAIKSRYKRDYGESPETFANSHSMILHRTGRDYSKDVLKRADQFRQWLSQFPASEGVSP